MSGEYEPNDSRNVTGAAEAGGTKDGRWTNEAGQTPDAAGQPQQSQSAGQGQQGGMSDSDPDGARLQADEKLDQEATQASGSEQGGGGQPGTFTGPSGGQAGDIGAGRSDSTESGGSGGQQRQFDQSASQMGGAAGSDSRFADQIRAHMEVVDAEGTAVGTVDACENGRIKLTRSGSSDGQHHYLELDQIAGVEGDVVRLSGSGDTIFGSGAQ